jgi:hypothetical protein
MSQTYAATRVPSGEVVLPFSAPPPSLGAASAARSTLVTTSIQSLRRRGLYERYARHLTGEQQEAMRMIVAGTWLPMELAFAHYAACDALGLGAAEQTAIAMEVGDRVNGTFLGTVLRMAKSLGASPWSALGQSAKLYERLFCGGGIAVSRKGPKDARVDLIGNPLCTIEYFRTGVCGVYQAALQPLCRRVSALELVARATSHSMSMRIAWA